MLGLAGAAVWHCILRRRSLISAIPPAALHLHCTSSHPPRIDEPVSVLLPLRHEPETAVAAVCAALGQRGVDHLDVVVLDDGCPAETRAALRREFADDPRVRLLSAAPLPRGWSRLAHRSHQLAVAARGSVLIFAEPCAPLGPYAAASATALLRRERLDLAVLDSGRPAPAPAKSTTARTQRAAPPDAPTWAWIHPGRFATAIDAGAYWRIGGYRAAAGDTHPLALLRTVRRASGRVAVADGRPVIPPAKRIAPVVCAEPPELDGGFGSADERTQADSSTGRSPLSDTARRLLAALVGTRA